MKQNVKHECDSSTLPLPPVFIVHHADQLVQLFSHIPWNRWLVRTNYSWFSSITFQSDVDKRVKCTCSIRQQAHKLEDGDGVEHLGKWTRTVHQYLPWPAMWSPDLDLPPPRHPLPPPRPSRCFFSGGPEHHSYSFYKPVCRTIIGPWLSHKTPFKWKRIELNWKFGENVLKIMVTHRAAQGLVQFRVFPRVIVKLVREVTKVARWWPLVWNRPPFYYWVGIKLD